MKFVMTVWQVYRCFSIKLIFQIVFILIITFKTKYQSSWESYNFKILNRKRLQSLYTLLKGPSAVAHLIVSDLSFCSFAGSRVLFLIRNLGEEFLET